eukprot:360150-Pelagomonas_calceolata.AAC.7
MQQVQQKQVGALSVVWNPGWTLLAERRSASRMGEGKARSTLSPMLLLVFCLLHPRKAQATAAGSSKRPELKAQAKVVIAS